MTRKRKPPAVTCPSCRWCSDDEGARYCSDCGTCLREGKNHVGARGLNYRADLRDTVVFLTCIECGNQQGDMGRGVACEECGHLMPPAEAEENAQAALAPRRSKRSKPNG